MSEEEVGQDETRPAEEAGAGESGHAAPEQAGEAAAAGAAEDAVEADGDAVACDLLVRWFDKVSADCTKALEKAVGITVGEVGQGPEALSSAAEGAAVAAVAAVKGAQGLAVALVAGEEAAVTLARAVLGDEELEEVEEKALCAFGELARQIWGSLEAAWHGEGAPDLMLEPAAPERVEGLPAPFDGDDAEAETVCARVEVAGAEAEVTFLVPTALARRFPGEDEAPAATQARIRFPAELRRILRIRVPLVVEIANRKSKVGAVLAFRPGSVIEFNKKCDDMLELYADHAHIGRGEAVKVGESFGIRVLEIDSIRDRWKNLCP